MRAAGAVFEQRACAELQRAGFVLLNRNYTTRHGELDLVMLEGGTVVFVEVRHRLHASHGGAALSVTASKQARLIAAAELWLAAHPKRAHQPCRFDVVSYDGPSADARMNHWRNAFETC
ncbi:putative endonuclease [Dyella jiangningensis]|uniref:YraN family protein n=1 Tax=Dyella sp. AtDHG13 TaxID=1938897 RepID=UPI00088074FB|nr:YraN family protein [Dyella sp. AtDHG13]PXV59820.1 putative endonuclease [Dyella sp. AtDHG13]SDJ21315.1 putative endonuclease [Dyella jiangningensis]